MRKAQGIVYGNAYGAFPLQWCARESATAPARSACISTVSLRRKTCICICAREFCADLGASGHGRYLEVNDRFHRKVVEGTEPWVRTRTPDDAGALSPQP